MTCIRFFFKVLTLVVIWFVKLRIGVFYSSQVWFLNGEERSKFFFYHQDNNEAPKLHGLVGRERLMLHSQLSTLLQVRCSHYLHLHQKWRSSSFQWVSMELFWLKPWRYLLPPLAGVYPLSVYSLDFILLSPLMDAYPSITRGDDEVRGFYLCHPLI